VINIPREYDQYGRPDGYLIRRQAIDLGVPLSPICPFARAIVEALRWRNPTDLDVIAWNDYARTACRRRTPERLCGWPEGGKRSLAVCSCSTTSNR